MSHTGGDDHRQPRQQDVQVGLFDLLALLTGA
jgi:hypothetical protein